MKLLFKLCIAVVLMNAIACSKQNNNTNNTNGATDSLYISYTIDTTQYSDSSNQIVIGSSHIPSDTISASYATLFDRDNANNELGSIALYMKQDTLKEDDFRDLLNVKEEISNCIFAHSCIDRLNFSITLTIDGNKYESDLTPNTSVDNYIQINSVKNIGTISGNPDNKLVVSGEFNANVRYGSIIKNAKNGKFKLIFQEAK